MELTPHLTTPPARVTSIDATVWRDEGKVHFRYLVEGADKLVLPTGIAGRADELWRTTCFEAFIAGPGTAYREFNFAPSGQWAAYAFEAPRQGLAIADDHVEVWLDGGDDWIAVEAAVTGSFEADARLLLSAVIEELDGTKSYWALAHCSDKPDFHHPDCFVARLP